MDQTHMLLVDLVARSCSQRRQGGPVEWTELGRTDKDRSAALRLIYYLGDQTSLFIALATASSVSLLASSGQDGLAQH